MISIGGVVLNDNIIWENKNSYSQSSYSRRPTLQGLIIIQHSPINGRLITLTTISTGTGIIGYFTNAQIDSLRVYENSVSVVSFTYESETFTVIIEPGGINVEAIVPRPNHDSSDLYTGSINLIEVGV